MNTACALAGSGQQDTGVELRGDPGLESQQSTISMTAGGDVNISPPLTANKDVGLKWLHFWNYVTLPLGTIAEFMSSFSGGIQEITSALSAIIHVFVIYGLHKRRMWGWKLNWLVILMSFAIIAMPIQSGSKNQSQLITEGVFRVILAAVFWILPNFVYWRKRRFLFRDVSR